MEYFFFDGKTGLYLSNHLIFGKISPFAESGYMCCGCHWYEGCISKSERRSEHIFSRFCTLGKYLCCTLNIVQFVCKC